MTASKLASDGVADAVVGVGGAGTPDTPVVSLMGTVLRAISSIYDVLPDGSAAVPPDGSEDEAIYRCTLRDRLRKQLIMSESRSQPQRVTRVRRLDVVEPVVAGDRVRFMPTVSSGMAVASGVIEEVLPRKRQLSRLAVTTGSLPVGQTIIANLDQVVLVFAADNPEPHPGLIDRFLVSCESAELPVLLCINKCDLPISEEFAHDLTVYGRIGYRVMRVSAGTKQGMGALRAAVRGRTSAFVGPSGVGKSTLLNALQPGLGLRVGGISSATGKGTHTTRYAQLIPLQGGGFLADTPGLRQLGLWSIDNDELDRFFPEFRPFLAQCKFGNCAHVDDDGCAIQRAVEQGAVDERRYMSYVKLFSGG